MSVSIQILISAIAAILAVNWAYFKILRIAKAKNIVDNPNARKLQKTPVPVLGGVVVFFGGVAGLLLGAGMEWLLHGASIQCLFPIVCAMLIMIYTGAVDDIIGLPVKTRFVIEILTILMLIFGSGGCIDSLHGLWGIHDFSWWVAVPLTVFAGVGLINSINMIDGVNGLSSGLCILCSTLFGVAFIKVHDWPNSVLAFTMAASLLPFLLHNVFGKSSRMFIGDAGTMMMGLLMTWFTVSVLKSGSSLGMLAVHDNVSMVAMSLAILSVPVFDTIRVMGWRIINGKSPFSPDKSHLHHILVRIGLSHSVTSLFEILLDLLIVVIWALSVKLHACLDLQLYIVVLSAVVMVWGIFFFLRWQEKRHTWLMHRMAHFGIRSHLGHKEWWLRLQKWLDSPEKKYLNESELEVLNASCTPDAFYHLDDIAPDNYKEQDRKKMYDFLNGKAEVLVDDIMKCSGADSLRIDALIQEGIHDGFIAVIEEDAWGAPHIVTQNSELL